MSDEFVFLAVLAAALCCAPAWGETYLWSNRITRSHLSEGRSVYDAAEFGWLYLDVEDDDTMATQAHLNEVGTMPFVGDNFSFWNGSEYEAVSGTVETFNMIFTDMALGEEFLGYRPVNDQVRYIPKFPERLH